MGGVMKPNLILAVLACAFCLVLNSCTTKKTVATNDAIPKVAVVKVARETLSQELVLAAEFRPYQEVELHAKVAGYIKAIHVDIGDHVKKGQLLAVLEIPELQDEISQARAELASAKANYEISHLTYDRLDAAGKARPNLIAQQDIDDARAKDEVSRAQVETAKENLQRLETLYSYSNIVAPFTGVVTYRYADLGTMIQAGTASQTQTSPVVRVSQNDLLRLMIPVPESAAALIRLGSVVAVRVRALNKTFEGRVVRFADKLDLATRTMPTEIDVPNPNYELLPGMYAETTLTVSLVKESLILPVDAVRQEHGHSFVLLINQDGQVEQRTIKTGLETPDKIEVLKGLNESDEVLLGSASQIKIGEKVHPVVSGSSE